MAFDPRTLDRIATAEEVVIETPGSRRVVIWVVLVGTDVYVRSVRGAEGRWYRQLVRNKSGTLRIGRLGLPVRALVKKDAGTVRAVSLAFRQKYRGSGSLPLMLRPSTLPTTLRLEPA